MGRRIGIIAGAFIFALLLASCGFNPTSYLPSTGGGYDDLSLPTPPASQQDEARAKAEGQELARIVLNNPERISGSSRPSSSSAGTVNQAVDLFGRVADRVLDIGLDVAGDVLPAIRITTADEIRIGRRAKEEILREFRVSSNQNLTAYVRAVAARVASNRLRKDVPIEVTVIDTDMINAFALPGGYIFVTTGILGALNDEAALAFVLGHEISHVDLRQQFKRMMLAGAPLALLGGERNLDEDAIDQLGRIAAGAIMYPLSQHYEFNADAFGSALALQAGYNGFGGLRALQALEDSYKGGRQNVVTALLSSHPDTPERRSRLRLALYLVHSADRTEINYESRYAKWTGKR